MQFLHVALDNADTYSLSAGRVLRSVIACRYAALCGDRVWSTFFTFMDEESSAITITVRSNGGREQSGPEYES